MEKTYIGIDNGVTGTIGIISPDGAIFECTPIKKEQNYTKKKANVSRIEVRLLTSLLEGYPHPMCLLERPLVNSKMFRSTLSAIRALEATLNVLEMLGYPYEYLDSKAWQGALLPKGVKGLELKTASKDIGIRLFPSFREVIEKHGDADGLLIAEYARRNY